MLKLHIANGRLRVREAEAHKRDRGSNIIRGDPRMGYRIFPVPPMEGGSVNSLASNASPKTSHFAHLRNSLATSHAVPSPSGERKEISDSLLCSAWAKVSCFCSPDWRVLVRPRHNRSATTGRRSPTYHPSWRGLGETFERGKVLSCLRRFAKPPPLSAFSNGHKIKMQDSS